MEIWCFQLQLVYLTHFYPRKVIIIKIIIPIYATVLPTLIDHLLSGITDAEGCFSCSILSNTSNAYIFRYILSKKHEANRKVLEHIVNLFNEINDSSALVNHPVQTLFEVRVNGVSF